MANEENTIVPPLSGRVYGEIVYWGTVIGTIIAIIGTIVCFVSKDTYLPTSELLTGIWQQKSVAEIWQSITGSQPSGHWYLEHLTKGNGLTQFGLSTGVFFVIPAMFVSGFLLLKEKGGTIFGVLALIGGLITLISMLGLMPLSFE